MAAKKKTKGQGRAAATGATHPKTGSKRAPETSKARPKKPKSAAKKKTTTKQKAAGKRTAAKRTAAKSERPASAARDATVGAIGSGSVRSIVRTTNGQLPPWAVSPEQVRFFNDTQLSDVMRALLLAHAYRCGADITKVLVNTEDKAADGGCDAWTPAPPVFDSWLSDVDTCWQLKAGQAGQPQKLVGEVKKRIPLETLRAGGRFVAVTSRAGGGAKEHKSRRHALLKGVKSANLAGPRLEVLTSETLTTWINEHPAIAAAVRGLPSAWPLVRWTSDSLHKEPWHTTPALDSKLDALRSALEFTADTTLHIHVYGQPGAGKTRFALEACRGAPWSGNVLYLPQAADARVSELLDSVADFVGARLVLVIDEVSATQASVFNASVRTAGGRIRLITIGADGSPDSTNIDEVRIDGLDDETMAKVVLGWHPDLPPRACAVRRRFQRWVCKAREAHRKCGEP